MPAQTSFWKRVGSMFRPGSPPNGNGSGAPAPSTDAGETSGSAGDGEAQHTRTSLLPWTRRGATMAQMRDNYVRVVELMDSIQEHFCKQDQRAAELSGSLDRVAGIMDRLAEVQRAQGEHVNSIATHVDTASKHTAALSASLSQMPATVEAQTDAVRSIGRQLASAQESDERLAQSLQNFGQAVDSLRASGVTQMETLQKISAGEREQRETLTNFVHDQSRRFLIVISIAAVLVIGSLAASVITLIMVLGD